MIDWNVVFRDHDEGERELEAEVPPDLRGLLVRNGPGRQSLGSDRVNYFDANGLIAAVRFDGGRARLRWRHTRTAMFEAEEAAQRQLERRIFTNKPGRWSNLGDVKVANPASHDVVVWGGTMLATASSRHYALDPDTLETRGESDWGGRLPEGHTTCPMPRIDPTRDRLVCYSAERPARGPSRLTFRELDRDWRQTSEVAIDLRTKPFGVHDLAFTRRHYVVTEVPSGLSPVTALWGAQVFYDSITWPARPTVVHVVARHGGEHRTFELPPPIRGAFHTVNAWERGDDVIVELITGPSMPNVHAAYPPELGLNGPPTAPTGPRIVALHPDGSCTVERTFDVVGDLPEVDRRRHGEPHRWTWLLSPGTSHGEPDPYQQLWRHAISRVDREGAVETWDAGPSVSLSPPCFAATDDSEEGYVLTFALDLSTGLAEVVALAAADPAAGPVARVPLGVFLAPASHARFFE